MSKDELLSILNTLEPLKKPNYQRIRKENFSNGKVLEM